MNREEKRRHPKPGVRAIWRPVVLCVYMVASFVFHLEQNDYPYYYNADEPAKARQIRTGNWNFHHPMALLSTARFFVAEEMTLQATTERGRAVVSGYTALGMTCLVALAWWGFGGAAGVAAGIFLLLNPDGYLFARVFKEDPVLFAGMAGFALAAGIWLSRPGGVWNVVMLGLFAGLALSAKYIGVYLTGLMLLLLIFRKGTVPMVWKRLGIGIATAVGVFVVVNIPMIMAFDSAQSALSAELDRQVGGRFVERESWVQFRIFRSIWDSHDKWQWLLIGAGSIILFWRSNAKAKAVFFAASSVSLLYAAIICLAPGYAGRYGMPWSMFVSFFAAAGFGLLFNAVLRAEKGKRAIAGVLTVLCVAGLLAARMQYRNGLRPVRKDFATDSHRAVNDWLLKHAAEGAKVLQSKQVGLPGTDHLAENEPLIFEPGAEVTTMQFVSDFGTYDELMASDFKYVAIGSKEYVHFYRVPKEQSEAGETVKVPRSEFYMNLIDSGDWKQVMATRKRHVALMNADLYLFERKR